MQKNRMKARVAHGVPLPPTEIIEALNGPVWHRAGFHPTQQRQQGKDQAKAVWGGAGQEGIWEGRSAH